ncbi:MAG TPA: FxSxx-COOH system tetratricopeptide repeat protein [Ktedonobacterales bacterium]
MLSYRFQAVFWVQAETRGQLEGSLAQLATLLNLPERSAQEQAVIVAAVRRWLEAHPVWLLVLDNVEDVKLLHDVLPTQGRGHVLLTARAQAMGSVAQPAQVKSLTVEEAAHFLLRRAQLLAPEAPLEAAPPEQQQAARAIARELGGLPLALDQAAAYIEETTCTLTEYLTVFRKHRKAALHYEGEGIRDHAVVGVTWAASFEQVQQLSPAAVDLLRLCAFLAPEGIPEALIKDGGDLLPPALQEAARDALQWNATLAALRRFSLLDRQAETETLSLHRLVQAVVQEALPADEQRAWAERVVRLVNRAFPNSVEYATWDHCQQLLPHALMCASHIEEWHLAFPDAARLLNQAGYYLNRRARYAEALPLYQRALLIREQALGPVHPDVATSLNNLAELYRSLGKHEKMLPLLQRTLAIYEQALGPNHPDVAIALNNLGGLYENQGQYKEALPLYQRALKISEQALGPDHPDVAHRLNNLAALCHFQGQYKEALPLYQRALKIREQALGPVHPDVATSLNNLAELYREQGQYGEALPLYQRALKIREQALGPAHPDVANTLNNLAILYESLGQYEESLSLKQRALEIREQALGPVHPDVATSLNNLAVLYREQGQYGEALPLYQRALKIWEQALGPAHPNMAYSLNNLAGLYYSMNEYTNALPLMQRALAIREKALPSNHPLVEQTLENLAVILRAMRRPDEAAPLEQRAQAIRASRGEPGD